MTFGKIGARKMMYTSSGGGEKSWGKPAEWPDIEYILEQDVTPQEAISAGATHKWIALYYPRSAVLQHEPEWFRVHDD